jgi:hypothetical protein
LERARTWADSVSFLEGGKIAFQEAAGDLSAADLRRLVLEPDPEPEPGLEPSVL